MKGDKIRCCRCKKVWNDTMPDWQRETIDICPFCRMQSSGHRNLSERVRQAKLSKAVKVFRGRKQMFSFIHLEDLEDLLVRYDLCSNRFVRLFLDRCGIVEPGLRSFCFGLVHKDE